ncbi:SMP-30/gluconolactonase/LRE family protein [Variovorax dokdonensis]|uniref:SMP-30/gluconolactonase/LRE family protein n=1 Tax=Variovorax dokdonensis TaxID=344883 RepID=A0ABT7NBJ3_9BURK|nr:SMP-30/gluconolactonase/LRE family protein [Variovorax dokdonensis]MDM0045311.1 SMP-30/gluconolactonase/LRE family protein [Variovorax dokdonensis]
MLDAPACVWDAQAELGEGTLWSTRESALYWVDILGRRLHRWRPEDGQRRSWTFDEQISAVAERANGQGLLVTLRRGFAVFDPCSPGTPPRYLHQPDEPAGNRFNDGKCDPQGRFWGGTMDDDCQAPAGTLYRFDADGRCSPQEAGITVSNGPTWSADGRTFYFSDTAIGRTYAYDFDPDKGSLSNRREWLRLPKSQGFPDGMTTDAAGRIWICHWAGHCVSCHDPISAQELCRIELPVANVTDCAFGGPDLCTLYISTAWSGLDEAQRARQPLAGGLFAVTLDSPGVASPQFEG